MATGETSVTRENASTRWRIERDLARFGDQFRLLRVPWTDDSQRAANLIPGLHFVKYGRPCRVLAQVCRVPKDVEAVLRPRKRHIDAVGALQRRA